MPSVLDSEALHPRVQAFIAGALGGEATEAFDALALAIARFQAANVPAIARLGRARKVDLTAADGAHAIPAVPCDVFRLSRVAAHPASEDRAVFRTSGTTQGQEARGEHPLRTTVTYELGAIAWGARMLWPDRDPDDGRSLLPIVLAPSLGEQRDSSLAFMLDRFTAYLLGARGSILGFTEPAAPAEQFHVRNGALDVAGVATAAAEARLTGEPAIVFATSFALVHLLEGRGDRDLRLPPGSRVMQTGGFKGRSREVPAEELRRAIAEAFGVPEAHVTAEYGMTEMSSQLYEATLATAVGTRPGLRSTSPRTARHGVYAAPPWVRVTAVDPVSLEPLEDGELGIARVVDLANVDSAVAIQTADRIRVLPEGIELLGRAPGAPPRGCSIAIDEMLERR